ncbi:MAG: RING finger protein [Planctomycetota bacterium]
MKIRLRSKGKRCPLCRVGFEDELETYTCPGCDVRYHRDCAEELGGCATFGCERAGVGPDEETPAEQGRRARWRRHGEAARERRAGRSRLRAAHQAQAPQASGGLTLGDGFEVALGCLELISCLAVFVLLGALTPWGIRSLELDPARLARAVAAEPGD